MVKRFIIFFLLCVIVGGVVFAMVIQVVRQREQQRQAALAKKMPDYKITFIEGWTVADMAAHLEKKQIMSAQEFTAAEKNFNKGNYSFLSSIPANQDLEGFLFPDTYNILKTASGTDIVTIMVENFNNRLETLQKIPKNTSGNYIVAGYEGLQLSPAKPPGLSLYDIVTMASIIEKETGRDLSSQSSDQIARLAEERRTVAGIFYNRLLKGQALESDATVNYATGKHVASASASDIATDSPYNTYKYAGLPPGPIASPSLMSIDAAMHPIKTDYYYFFHKQPSGEIVYSKTFEEHRAKKARYLQ